MFAQRLKQLRAEKKLTQIDLARDIEVTQSTVGKWETGARTPDAETLKKIADYFGVSVDYLLGGSEITILARHLSEVPEEDREQLISTFKNTVDIYLKAKGLK